LEGCTIANNGGDNIGIWPTAASAQPFIGFLRNTILWGAGGWNMVSPNAGIAGPIALNFRNVAVGGATSGNYQTSTVTPQNGHIELSANPFVDDANGDYSLNEDAGSGALCKGSGYPGTMAGSTSEMDLGAVQSGAGAGGGSSGPKRPMAMSGGLV
jgi:hypothetical protein